MAFAIFVCSAYLNSCSIAEGGDRDAGKVIPTVIYKTRAACEKRLEKEYAPQATANDTYFCYTGEGKKWRK